MGKSTFENFNSFSKNGHNNPPSPRTPHSSASFSHEEDTSDQHSRRENLESISEEVEYDLSSRAQVTHDIDQFTNALSSIQDKSSCPPDVPDSIGTFSKIVESRIAKYNSGDANFFGKMTEEDSFFIEAVNRISKLTNSLSEFSSNESTNSWLNRTSVVLQRAMTFLEEEFRALLDDSRNCCDLWNLSFNSRSHHQQDHHCLIPRESDPGESDDYPGYPPEVVVKMHRIATTMISAGYETECLQVYSISRRNAIRIQMKRLEFETINMDDALRMPWEVLEKEIWRWTKVVKKCSETILPGEKNLGESIFADYPIICKGMFSNLARSVVIQLLDFAEATAMAKRSAEKLFKFLDTYEALQSLAQSVESCSGEISDTADRIGASAASNFCELENSIKSDVARTPVPGGAVHPLTRYVINYLEYACEYKDALEKIFAKQAETENRSIPLPNSLSSSHHDLDKETDSPHPTTPFGVQVVTVMDLLDSNLDTKSRQYRDPSLRNLFLMNNGRYILQKVKGSNEIRQVMGDTWCRKRSTIVRQYHKNYQRETWNRVLQCLSHDGLLINNGKINKPLLKERFKIFTTTFDDIHRTQSTWVVSDEQLQSELRISVSAVVIPAYRAFVGRFKQYLDSSKHVDKYIKYQPEDIEALIEGLFEGNATSMARRRT